MAEDVWNLRRVAVDEDIDKGWHSVVLDASRRGESLHFELQLDADEDEREDGYCIIDSPAQLAGTIESCIADIALHRTLYGGIEECGVTDGILYFVFSAQAQALFSWPRVLRFSLSLDEGQRQGLESALRTILSIGCEGVFPVLRL